MKNLFSIKTLLCTFIVLLSFLILNVCCKSTDEDEDVIKKPEISFMADDARLTVSIYLRDDIEYLNLFRVELSDDASLPEDIEKKALNIAEIIPNKKSLPAISYLDDLIVEGKKYAYCVRYSFGNRYEYTGWSDWPIETESENDLRDPPTGVPAEYASDDVFKNTVADDCYFLYNDEIYQFAVQEQPIPHIKIFDGWDSCLVVSDGTKTKTFKVSPSKIDADYEVGDIIDLRSTIMTDFFDKTLTVKGIIYRKFIENIEKKGYDVFRWSQIAPVAIKKSEEASDGSVTLTEVTTIYIANNNSPENKHDYGDYGNAPRTANADTSIYTEERKITQENYRTFGE